MSYIDEKEAQSRLVAAVEAVEVNHYDILSIAVRVHRGQKSLADLHDVIVAQVSALTALRAAVEERGKV